MNCWRRRRDETANERIQGGDDRAGRVRRHRHHLYHRSHQILHRQTTHCKSVCHHQNTPPLSLSRGHSTAVWGTVIPSGV